jgi:hypothetical protein
MEQIIQLLKAMQEETIAQFGSLDSKMDSHQERMLASQDRMFAKLDAWLQEMKARSEKRKATPEQMANIAAAPEDSGQPRTDLGTDV